MTTLTFKGSKELKQLAERTLYSNKFKIPYQNKHTTKKGMFFVKDEGIYLMQAFSSKKNYVIYALGYNPKTNNNCWDNCRDAVGGDDFAESIPLDKEQLQRLIEGGSLSIKIISETQMEIRA
jgi:hypothetical protein|tara:strand:- start:413 stop:778 length:366 start_codon:yes stop_codon:yes gene_type:complete